MCLFSCWEVLPRIHWPHGLDLLQGHSCSKVRTFTVGGLWDVIHFETSGGHQGHLCEEGAILGGPLELLLSFGDTNWLEKRFRG